MSVRQHFLKDLRNLDWSYFNHYHDLDEACKKFNENVKSVAEKHAPFVAQIIPGRVKAWVTEDLTIAIRERDFLCKKVTKSKSILDWEAFKQKRNHVNRLKNRLKNEYYNEVLQQQQNRPKQLWKTLKQLVPGKSGNVTSIKRVTLNDGSETTHPKEISNTFNSFFVSVGAKLAIKFTSDTTKINPPVSRHEFRWTHIENKRGYRKTLGTQLATPIGLPIWVPNQKAYPEQKLLFDAKGSENIY